MELQKTGWILFVILLCSCTKGKPVTVPEINTDFNVNRKAEVSGFVFFIGPELDSTDVDIIADCDCCASELAFINDSSFLYEELCLGGNAYAKGDYIVFGDLLILRTNQEVLSEEYEIGFIEDDSPSSYEIVRQKPNYIAYQLSELKGKQVITYSNDGHKEYGVHDHISVTQFLRDLRKEKAIRAYLREI